MKWNSTQKQLNKKVGISNKKAKQLLAKMQADTAELQEIIEQKDALEEAIKVRYVSYG